MNKKTQTYTTLAVGVTGGIGSGKSKVCEIFSSLGAFCLHADRIAQSVIEHDPEVIRKMIEIFGAEAYTSKGALNKSLISSQIFNFPEIKKIVDETVHPPVLDIIKKDIYKAKKDNRTPFIFVEAALIYEAKSEAMYDYVIVVDAPKESRIRWIIERDKSSETEIIDKIKSQLPAEETIARADFVIKNLGTLQQLEKQTRFIFTILKSISEARKS
jgi:dephospho-CoA kinase